MDLMIDVHLPSLESVEAGAPVNEIEITLEMIKAGVEELSGHYFEVVDGEPFDEILRTVFLAVAAARPKDD